MDEPDDAFDAAAAVASLPGLFTARDLAGAARVFARIDWPQGRVPPWGESYVRLVRGTTAGDAAELIHLIAREVRGSGGRRPAHLLAELSRLLPDEVLPEVCVDWLAGADRSGGAVAWDGEVARVVGACLASGVQLAPVLVAAIRRMPDYPLWSGRGVLAELAAAFPRLVLNPGEAWSDAALADADQPRAAVAGPAPSRGHGVSGEAVRALGEDRARVAGRRRRTCCGGTDRRLAGSGGTAPAPSRWPAAAGAPMSCSTPTT